MSEENNPLDHTAVQDASVIRYAGAFVVAFPLMVCGALLTSWTNFSAVEAYTWIALVGLVAFLAQLFLLFKLGIAQDRFWYTAAFAGTLPLVVLAVGLTQFMFHFLDLRTMVGMGG
jgi:heme/copper-type cytochrome/quinol oxidase subunit 4